MTDVNLTLSFNPTADMNTTDFKRRSTDHYFYDVAEVLGMSGRYSPFIFRNNYRKSDNYQQNVSNCIVLDFDDGFTREEFKKISDFACAIGTTKSHMIEKNGVVCERFRVVIPTETAINLTTEQYCVLMQEVFETYSQADTACKDTARAYSGFPATEVEIIPGRLYDWEGVYKRRVDKIEVLRRWQEKERSVVPEVKHDGSKADWYRENWLSDAMRVALGVDDKFISGNRNNAIYSFARYLKDVELTDSEICNAIDWINNGELGDHEIKQVLRGLRIAA